MCVDEDLAEFLMLRMYRSACDVTSDTKNATLLHTFYVLGAVSRLFEKA